MGKKNGGRGTVGQVRDRDVKLEYKKKKKGAFELLRGGDRALSRRGGGGVRGGRGKSGGLSSREGRFLSMVVKIGQIPRGFRTSHLGELAEGGSVEQMKFVYTEKRRPPIQGKKGISESV